AVDTGEGVAVALRLQDDDVRRRCLVVGLDRSLDAAHVDGEVGLGEAAVFGRRARGGGGCLRHAKHLHRHAWRRRDVIVAMRRRGGGFFLFFLWAAHHFSLFLRFGPFGFR